MVELRHGGSRPGHIGPPRRVQVVLPGLVIALAGGWLFTCSIGAGPGAVVESATARWNGVTCGIVLMVTGGSGWLWSRTAVRVAAGVGPWLTVAPALMRYDQGDAFRSTWIGVATSVVIMLAAERWASGVAGSARDDR